MNDLAGISLSEASKKLASRDISSVELVRSCRSAIEQEDTSIHAYVEVFDDIENQAAKADAHRDKEHSGALFGIPLAIKDNILIKGRRASAGSKMLENYIASYDATVIQKLKKEGAIFLGRTNMDEFAMGSSTEFSAYGVTRNPHDISRVAGGSSGGSAAAVAAGMALGALGSDTGGSVREPASFCGVIGLKPTYGAVSRSGLMAMGSSLDQIGPFARTIEDTKLLFDAIRGRDELDSTSLGSEVYPTRAGTKTIGVPRHLFTEGIDQDVLTNFEQTLKGLVEQGYEVRDISLPSANLALAVYYILMPAEASTNLARYDGVRYGLSLKGDTLLADYERTRREGFGSEVRRRIMLGTYVLSAGYYDAYYGKATLARRKLSAEVAEVLSDVDVIATPTVPSPAFKIGEKSDPISMYLADIFTVTANLTGNPAISIPMGTVVREHNNLPVGIQLTAIHGGEDTLFAVGKDIEKA